jgi:peptidoglycan hydrolase-like protein with peptidoglycan-binding domain
MRPITSLHRIRRVHRTPRRSRSAAANPKAWRRALLTAALLAGVVAISSSASNAESTRMVSATGTQPPTSPRSPLPNLLECPNLRLHQEDPVGGKRCVAALQLALQHNGYPDQQVTGRFRAQTYANVRDFQRSHAITPAIGIVGVKTKNALLGTTGSTQPPSPGRRSFTKNCTPGTGVCDLYLHRTETRRYAEWLAAHPYVTAGATQALVGAACQIAFRGWLPLLSCEVIGSAYVDEVERSLQEASRQQQCLRLTVTAILPSLHASAAGTQPYCAD